MATLHLILNGRAQSVETDADAPLLWVLRQDLQLTGTKFGCGMALCGACTVQIDGIPSRSCVTPVSAAAGRRITTIEGLSGRVAEAVKRAWLELDVAQCGYCQPGQVVAATALLSATPAPSDAQIDQAMSGNLCRCGTYPRIRAAVHAAAKARVKRGVACVLALAASAAHPQGDPWTEIAGVLRHPRCMNCHTVTEFPRQGDDRHRHRQLVMRGASGHGVPTLPCAACHQDTNSADGRVPGAPHWHLAPLSMGWEGLDDWALCAALLDPRKNGNRDLAKLVEHMTGDALVQWAWKPGSRPPPPLSQAGFHEAVRRWAAGGAPCP